jgi:RHS repeat-associated protein
MDNSVAIISGQRPCLNKRSQRLRLSGPVGGNGTVFYQPDVVSATDYYPFGSIMPGRSFNTGNYRYGFQGQEMDNEIKGVGNSINYKYRMHDPRLGRFFAVDPLAPKYPHNSPYTFSENRVIDAIELEGAEKFLTVNNVETGYSTTVELQTAGKLGDGVLMIQETAKHQLAAFYMPSIKVSPNGETQSQYGTNLDVGEATGNNNTVKKFLIGKSNPLSPEAKGQILTKSIHNEQQQAAKEATRSFADNLELTGDVTELAGYSLSSTVVGAPVGAFLIALGQITSNFGLGLNLTMDLAEGDISKFQTRVAINIISGGSGGLTKRATGGLTGLSPEKRLFHEGANTVIQSTIKGGTEAIENENIEDGGN